MKHPIFLIHEPFYEKVSVFLSSLSILIVFFSSRARGVRVVATPVGRIVDTYATSTPPYGH